METDYVKTLVFDVNAKTYMLEKFQRNTMIIFNHENFLIENKREGTSFDEDALKNTFEQFRFNVAVHKDLEKVKLLAELQEFSKQNFAEFGCICVAVLTHGSDHGYLKAFDAYYSERELFACFDASENPSLAGKPIIFLIQACRGPNLACPVPLPGSDDRVVIQLDANVRTATGYCLPTESDMVIFHSCFFGRASAREKNRGTWFIQTVCEQINLHASTDHLEKIFLRVRKSVALEKEFGQAKQMPVMTTTLLRKLYLKRPGETESERQHLVTSEEHQIAENPRNTPCSNCIPSLIQSYFESTTIVRSVTRDLHYCENSYLTNHQINMNQIIDIYRAQKNVHSYKYSSPLIPTTEHGVLIIKERWRIPLYVIADIRKHHLVGHSEAEFEYDVHEHLKVMGRLSSDDKAHLLHHSLGGSSKNINIIPMARNVHRRLIVEPDSEAVNGSLVPRSFWKSNEDWIWWFLKNYPDGRVAWKVAVQYEEDLITNPDSFINYRPISFSLQYSAYRNHNDNTSVYYISKQMTFRNDNNDNPCGNDLLPFDHPPNIPEGKFGSLMSRGVWPSGHQQSFSYTIQDRTFFYGQSLKDGRLWFIQELLPYGQMGKRISRGYWEYDYHVVFPFVINGRQFFYGHNYNTRLWVIQELLPHGNMGKVRSSGYWDKRYQTAFPFSILGKHYFFAQSILDGRDWFIRELLPGGAMGQETSAGTWLDYYQIVFPYKIDEKQFFYGHGHREKSWFLQELLPGGKMGQETKFGYWESAHRVTVPYSINGKQYFFGQKVENGNWYIQELLPNGKMGYEITYGVWRENYSVAFTFCIDDRHFLYGHSIETLSWFIKELL